MTTRKKNNRNMNNDQYMNGLGQTTGGSFPTKDESGFGNAATTRRQMSTGKAILAVLAAIALIGVAYALSTQGRTPPVIPSSSEAESPSVGTAQADESAAKADGATQVIRMNVTSYGWQPDRFVLKAGVPVKWQIDAQQLTGCNKAIKVPSLGLSFDLRKGLQTIEFTPTTVGTIPWSCWMGMIQGTFIVTENVDTTNQGEVKKVLDQSPPTPKGGSCGMGQAGGGCGCGMM
jgi:hypothetical protein